MGKQSIAIQLRVHIERRFSRVLPGKECSINKDRQACLSSQGAEWDCELCIQNTQQHYREHEAFSTPRAM